LLLDGPVVFNLFVMKPIMLQLTGLFKESTGTYEVHMAFKRQAVVLKEQHIAEKYANQMLDRIIEKADTGIMLVSCWFKSDLYKEIKDDSDAVYADCIQGIATDSKGAPLFNELLIEGARAYVTIPSFVWDDGGNIVVMYTLNGKARYATGSANSLPRVGGKQVTNNLFLAGLWVGEEFKPAMRGRELALGIATPFKFK
jgi:hypothetical protein